jgi:tetratricopeptide (TPR) repeat protein
VLLEKVDMLITRIRVGCCSCAGGNGLNIDCLFNEGIALAKAGKNSEALVCFDQAIKIDPRNFYAWQCRGYIFEQMGRLPEALVCFEKTIELDPNNADAWLNKGDVLFCLQRLTEAADCFDKSIELDPEREYTRSVRETIKLMLKQ